MSNSRSANERLRRVGAWGLVAMSGLAFVLVAGQVDTAAAFKLPKFGKKKSAVAAVAAGAIAKATRAKAKVEARGDSAAALAGIGAQPGPGASPSNPTPGGSAGGAAPDSAAQAGMLDEILLSPEPYYYETVGRRDPFVSLVSDAYIESSEEEDRTGPDDLTVVGVLWSDTDRYALVETPEGKSMILREGDRYANASVTRVSPEGVTLYVSEFGVGRQVRLQVIDAKKQRINHVSRER
ncbi:MAG: hypothetical protein IT349_06360 [Candidatus Eisenbacteria bacterium]|nr:hypothetical protein [Candidatus Eisenbacteria bacterium]